jgi:NAD+ diphosphatase
VLPYRAEPQLPYNGLRLTRGPGLRGSDGWSTAVIEHPGSLVIPLRKDQCLVRGPGRELVTLPLASVDDGPVSDSFWCGPGRDGSLVFLGRRDDGAGIFALDLSDRSEPAALELAGADKTLDTRSLFSSLDAQQSALLAYARGLLRWHRDQKYCGACGSRSWADPAGHQRTCSGTSCGKLLFPRIEPAVITLVLSPSAGGSAEPGPKALMGRHQGSAPDAWALIAGFVDIGESLEDAVRREVAEETGVAVGEVRYQASQAWPFPAGLMLGFRAVALREDIAVDQDEIVEARWFTRAELGAHLGSRSRKHRDSIGMFLLEDWLSGPD